MTAPPARRWCRRSTDAGTGAGHRGGAVTPVRDVGDLRGMHNGLRTTMCTVTSPGHRATERR
ncbi:hypothetical protein FRIGORI9N_240106 [Frigoribacterium sp. 9N]|nr:hypothetical protein FRIGORI9N_240106 [Frigoribacterium sp. 9N]